MDLHIQQDNFSELLHRFSTPELEKMVLQFPYLHQAQLLLAKKYQMEKNVLFDNQLQVAALYTQDRALFYALFHENAENKETNPNSGTAPLEMTKNTNDGRISSSIVLENVPIEEVEISRAVVSEAVVPVDDGEQYTFDEWLQAFSGGQEKVPATTVQASAEREISLNEENDDELDHLVKANISVDYLHELVSEETHYSRGLDEFIQQQIDKRKQSGTRVQGSNGSSEPMWATETLAKLYEDQKLYAKAIQAYEALILKFPEKSDLFAARIKYLKSLN